jgi:hypothetical protein
VKLLAKKLMNFGRDISREALRKMISWGTTMWSLSDNRHTNYLLNFGDHRYTTVWFDLWLRQEPDRVWHRAENTD